MNITEIHEMKSANIAQAKKVWDARYLEGDEKMTAEKAVSQGMFKIEDLKDGMTYYGYSPQGVEATWRKKDKKFLMLLGGLPTGCKYYENFIPTTNEELLQESMPKSKEELFEELTQVTIKLEENESVMTGARINQNALHEKYKMITGQIDRLVRREIKEKKEAEKS